MLLALLIISFGLNAEKTDKKNTEEKKIEFTGLYGSAAQGSSKDPFSQNKFIPGISFILDFSYNRKKIDGDLFSGLEVPGFFEVAGHAHGEDGHSHGGGGQDGFNLNYGELVLYAPVDPYFDLFTTFHLSEGDFEIEEAYVTTRKLPFGLGVKIGKFFSGFGRLNAKHSHVWDFADMPLVLRAFFGEEGLVDKGIQVNWVAPVDFYLTLGVESMQGTNESSFGTEGFSVIDEESEEELDIEDTFLPNQWTVFGKTSVESGNFIFLAGASFAWGNSRLNHLKDEHEAHAFSGDTKIFGLEFTARYDIDSYRHLALSVEYLTRSMKGTHFELHEADGEAHEDEGEHEHELFEVEMNPFEKNQSGLYAQLVYRFHKLWRAGARWDWLNKNDILLNDQSLKTEDNLNRFSIMIDYNPTEFSRIRLQYNLNRFAFIEEERRNYNEWMVQFNLAIGAHGAHSF